MAVFSSTAEKSQFKKISQCIASAPAAPQVDDGPKAVLAKNRVYDSHGI